MTADPQTKRLWSFDRQTEVDNVDRNVRSPGSRAICYAVVDAALDIRHTDIVSPDHVAAFVRAAAQGHAYVFGLGGKRLVQCSHFSAFAADALRTLAKHRRWRPRFNVMCVLGCYGPPEKLALELLSAGLTDKAARVACRAAAACDDVGTPAALKLLDERLSVETRPAVIESLEFTAGLMRTPEVVEGLYLVREYRGCKFMREAPRDRRA